MQCKAEIQTDLGTRACRHTKGLSLDGYCHMHDPVRIGERKQRESDREQQCRDDVKVGRYLRSNRPDVYTATLSEIYNPQDDDDGDDW